MHASLSYQKNKVTPLNKLLVPPSSPPFILHIKIQVFMMINNLPEIDQELVFFCSFILHKQKIYHIYCPSNLARPKFNCSISIYHANTTLFPQLANKYQTHLPDILKYFKRNIQSVSKNVLLSNSSLFVLLLWDSLALRKAIHVSITLNSLQFCLVYLIS